MPSLKKVRQEAWKFYKEWRKGKTYSPALKSEVRVSLKGWAHLSGSDKARKKRTYQDAYRRYKLLPYAKEIRNLNNHPEYNREERPQILCIRGCCGGIL